MKNKTVKEIEYKGRKLVITLFEDYIKEIETLNWYWDSLIFPDNNCDIAKVEEVDSKNILCLVTHGQVIVHDKNKNIIDLDEISELAKQKKIYDKKYNIWSNNWFSLDFGGKFEPNKNYFQLLEDVCFEDEPSSREELIDCLIEEFVEYFTEE